MRTGLTNESVERLIGNDRVTISVRRDDLTKLKADLQDEYGTPAGVLNEYAQRVLEVIEIAFKSQ